MFHDAFNFSFSLSFGLDWLYIIGSVSSGLPPLRITAFGQTSARNHPKHSQKTAKRSKPTCQVVIKPSSYPALFFLSFFFSFFFFFFFFFSFFFFTSMQSQSLKSPTCPARLQKGTSNRILLWHWSHCVALLTASSANIIEFFSKRLSIDWAKLDTISLKSLVLFCFAAFDHLNEMQLYVWHWS